MSGQPIAPPPGWYPAKGDPPGTQRYWNGTTWEGGPRPVPGVAVSDVLPLADLTRRSGARLIDLVIWVVIALVLDRILVLLSFDGFGVLSSLVGGLAIAGYEAYLVATSGATVGKRVIGLSVINEDGSTVGPIGAVRRVALLVGLTLVSLVPYIWVLSWVVLALLVLAGILMIYADDRQQTPWDKIGRTLVVMR
ncbi:MAG: RDD family protein [Actinomycetota bacterium]